MNNDFYKKIKKIIKKDPRYKIEAYEFLMRALFYTQSKFKRRGHLSGRELLEGIKAHGVELFGPLTQTVFEGWGVKETVDFGEMVFNLVNIGLLKKTAEDSLDDFKDVYEFKTAFQQEHKQRLLEDIKRELNVPDYSKKKDDKKI